MRRQLGARATQLYFFGALCWKTATVVHTIAQLAAKWASMLRSPEIASAAQAQWQHVHVHVHVHVACMCMWHVHVACGMWCRRQRSTKPPSFSRLSPPRCKTSYEQPGFLSKYAFGLRYEIFRRHHAAPDTHTRVASYEHYIWLLLPALVCVGTTPRRASACWPLTTRRR